MIVFLREIKLLLINKLSPKEFKLNSEIYGLQYDQNRNNKLIKKVMLTIDLSIDAIHFALKNKVNLIISHHGLVNSPIKKFNQNLINKLTLLTKYPISIFVLNSSFVSAEGGISDTLVETLYLKLETTFNIKTKRGTKIPIGRICSPRIFLTKNQPFTLENLIKRIKVNLDLTIVSYVGDLNKRIKRICIVGGDKPSFNYIKKAMILGCDCYISGRINYMDAIFARDVGLSLIEISHYKNEILALKKLCNVLSLEFPRTEFLLFESNDPFKTYL